MHQPQHHTPAEFSLNDDADTVLHSSAHAEAEDFVRASLGAGWSEALAPVWDQLVAQVANTQRRRESGEHVLPPQHQLLRAFAQDFSAAKVLIVGQDPYPTPGHAVGLSFSMSPQARPLARSLVNIYQELRTDLGVAPAEHGDLSAWQTQGVMLLNRVLTVRAGQASSDARSGWEPITECAVRALAQRRQPLVAILWGAQARTLQPVIEDGERTAVVASAHPSPLSASRGFFGSRPFSRANEFLVAHGVEPVNWQLPPAPDAGQQDTLPGLG